MNIKIDTTISDVFMFLKKDYSLYLSLENNNISKIKSLPIIKKTIRTTQKLSEKVYFTIKDETSVLELINFCSKEE